MSKNENKGFHTLRARSEDKLPDLLEFRCRLDAKTDGIHFIKEVIDRLWWRMYIRLKQPRFEPLASHDRFARSKLYMGFDFIAPMFGIRVEDIHVKAVIIDITAYLPRLAQLLNAYQSDKTTGVSRFCHDDWKRIWIALSMLSEAAPTVSEALTLAAILKWTSTDNALSSNDAQIEFCNDFLQFCEDAYSSELFSAATRLTNAVKDGDIESAVTELLSIRANFVLEAELLSSQHAQKVAAILDQIAVSFEALKAKATTAAEALVVELSSSVLSMKWRDASQACTAVSDFIEHENLGLALDVEHYVLRLKLLKSAAFAAFLYAGPANLSLTKREDSDDYKRLLEMQDELEYEFLPTGSLHTLLQLIRANEVSEVVLQTKSLSVDNLITDVRKTARYLLPQGHLTEYWTSAELWSFRIKEDDAEDVLLDTKFLLDWFAPPLILWAIRMSEDDAVRAVLESLNLFNKAKALRGLDLEFCTKLLRSLDQLQPDRPPILFGHVTNIYFDIIAAHGSIPSDIEGLQQVIEELYMSMKSNPRDRLQKSLLHSQAQFVIDKAETDDAKSFLIRCYERSGILVTDEFCAQLTQNANLRNGKSVQKARSKRDDNDLDKLEGMDLDGDFFEVRDRLEGGEHWDKVCDVVQEICTEKFSGDLKTSLGSTFRDAVGNLQYHDFVKSMVARGVLFKVAKRVINEHRIGKWQIAEDLAFFRDVPLDDRSKWKDKDGNQPKSVDLAKRNFNALLTVNCRFSSVAASDLLEHGHYSEEERKLYSKL